MPSAKTKRAGGGKSRGGKKEDNSLSARTKKQIDSLPQHAQRIYKKVHADALEHTKNLKKGAGVKNRVLNK